MAFVGVNLLRPEYQYNALETVLTRPVSFRVILTVRVFLGALGVLALQALLGLYMKEVMNKPFDLGLAILAGAVSMAFLTSLAVAVAAAWRSPTFGLLAAGLFWALDLLKGPSLNPILTLRGYAAHLGSLEGEYSLWWVGKIGLAIGGLALVVFAAQAASRPAVQRSLRRYVRTGLVLLLIAAAYVSSGVFAKVRWGESQEAVLMNHSRLWYRGALSAYGPLPVAYLFGPAFPHLTGYRAPWRGSGGALTQERSRDLEGLKTVAFGYPKSRWCDNALYELGRVTIGDAAEDMSGDSARLAIDCFEHLVNDYPSSPFTPAALEKLAGAYEIQGRPQDARAAVDRLLDQYSGTPSATEAGNGLLDRLMAAGEAQLPDALTVAEKLLKGASSDERPDLLLQTGLILSEPSIGRYEEARKALQQAVDEAAARTQELALASATEPDAEMSNRLRQLADVRTQAGERMQTLP